MFHFSKILLVIISLTFSVTSATAQQDKWHFFTGLGVDFWVKNKEFSLSPPGYEGVVGKYSALPVDKFKQGELNKMQNRGSFRVSGGVQKAMWNSFGLLRTEVGVARTSFNSDNTKCLRFTDQIDPDQGFVNASGYEVNEIRGTLNYLSFKAQLLFRTEDLKREQRLGLGFMSNIVFRSDYSLQIEDRTTGSPLTYKSEYLKWADHAFGIAPELVYQGLMAKFGNYNLFIHIAISTPARLFTPQKNYEKQDLSWIANFGLILE